MHPVIQSISLIGLLSLSLFSITGCGEKRIHVATASGSPGDDLNSSATEPITDASNKSSGLSGTSLGESSLAGQSSPPEEVQAETVKPAAPLEPLNFAYEPTLPTLPTEAPMNESLSQASTGSSSDGSPLNDSLSQPLAEAPSLEKFDKAPIDNSDPSAPFADGQEIATQSHSTQENGGNTDSGENSPISAAVPDGFPNSDAGIEPIPEGVQVAKAEPSDMLQEQLDKIKEEELATVSAGLEDVFFQFDSWTLTAEAKDSLERDLAWLTNTPSSLLVIEGHADQRGTQAYNMVLGKKRAMTIRDYLSQLGVDPSRLTVISYGKDKPFCQDVTEVCHQLNRRGHLLVQN